MIRVEGLRADRQPVDAGVAVRDEVRRIDRARIGFERDFRVRGDVDARADAGEQRRYGVARDQTRRAAADEDRFEAPFIDEFDIGREIVEQAFDDTRSPAARPSRDAN